MIHAAIVSVALTSASYADITGLTSGSFTLEVACDILVFCSIDNYNSGTADNLFNLQLDGVTQGADPFIQNGIGVANKALSCSNMYLLQNVAAGAHTIKIQGKSSSGTLNTNNGNLIIVPLAH